MLDKVPFLGVGLSFRRELKDEILSSSDRIDFLELIADQYIDKPLIREQEAGELSEQFPLILHGVDFSIGTASEVDQVYLEKFHRAASFAKPKWVSDHLCFTGVPGNSLGQLTPLPYTEETVEIVARNIRTIANTFNCPFLIENISYYFLVPPSVLTEAEFITHVVNEAGCWLLLDLANVRNNAVNNNYDPYKFLDEIPLDRVVQIHLAGGYYKRGLLLDSHSDPIHPEVFDMLRYATPKMTELRGINIERDQNFPPLSELLAELDQVREILAEYGNYPQPLKVTEKPFPQTAAGLASVAR